MSTSANLVLTAAAMVDNLVEKVNSVCYSVVLVLFVYNWEWEKCPLYK